MVSPPPPPSCELCHLPSNLFCPPDNAFLCWLCDTVVHSANFLVARHRRAFLCRSCASPTPWIQSGPRLAAQTHFCRLCSLNSAAGVIDDEECSCITQSSPDSISDDSCSDFRNFQLLGRSGRCREEISRDLSNEDFSSARGRDPVWDAEISCDGSVISSESVSEDGYEASYETNWEGTSSMTKRPFEQLSPHLHKRD